MGVALKARVTGRLGPDKPDVFNERRRLWAVGKKTGSVRCSSDHLAFFLCVVTYLF